MKERQNKKLKKIKIYSDKAKKFIEMEIIPANAPKELYECVACSNSNYGG